MENNLPENSHNNIIIDYYRPEVLNILTSLIKKNPQNACVLIMEIQNLHEILHLHGHENTQEILILFKNKIIQNNKNIQLYAINHDHFLITIENFQNISALEDIAQNLFYQSQIFGSNLHEYNVYVHITMGCTIIQEHKNPQTVLDEALFALGNAKNNSEILYIFNDQIDQKSLIEQEMAQANVIHQALCYKNICLAYQPIIETKSGKVYYYECLMRIIQDNNKIFSVGPFIPVAEKYGFVYMIDEMAMELAIEELKKNEEITLSFNISAACMNNDRYVAKLFRILKDNITLTPRIIIEITESSILKNLRKSAMFVADIQELGCKVALDDFGSGYTSFRHLKALSIDFVKIDGSFIKDINESSDNHVFVRTFIEMCHKLGIKTVAEFVESGKITKTLIDMGCDYLQGNYFSPAVHHQPWFLSPGNDKGLGQIKNK